MKRTFTLPDAGVMGYQLLCLLAAVAVFLVRAPQAYFLVNLLLLTIGIGTIAAIMRVGPILYLGVLVFSILLQGERDLHVGQASDILLSLGVLTFVAGHYRLQGLVHAILPHDQRRQTIGADGRTTAERPTRHANLVTVNEIGTLVLTLPIWALAAQLTWIGLSREWELPGIRNEVGRLLVAVWFLGMGLLLTTTVLAHWRRRQYEAVAADMILNDMLWRETRREQRRGYRWYVYGWMRGQEQREERRLWRRK